MEWYVLVVIAIAVIILTRFLKPKDEVVSTKKKELVPYTREQVAEHDNRDSLWLILKRDAGYFVYDVTSYIDEHPGGEAILSKAGADSTDSFFGPQHPPRVFDLIDDFCIGTLVD